MARYRTTSVPVDHETPTPEAAAGFEAYHAEPDWDLTLAGDDARREGRYSEFEAIMDRARAER